MKQFTWEKKVLPSLKMIDSFQNGCLKPPATGTSKNYLGGGFKYFLFSPLLGEMIQFD